MLYRLECIGPRLGRLFSLHCENVFAGEKLNITQMFRHDRMLPKESKSEVGEGSKISEEVLIPEAEKEKEREEESSERQKRGLGPRKDSVHPTFLMVNKCDHNELRRKFRNYEI